MKSKSVKYNIIEGFPLFAYDKQNNYALFSGNPSIAFNSN